MITKNFCKNIFKSKSLIFIPKFNFCISQPNNKPEKLSSSTNPPTTINKSFSDKKIEIEKIIDGAWPSTGNSNQNFRYPSKNVINKLSSDIGQFEPEIIKFGIDLVLTKLDRFANMQYYFILCLNKYAYQGLFSQEISEFINKKAFDYLNKQDIQIFGIHYQCEMILRISKTRNFKTLLPHFIRLVEMDPRALNTTSLFFLVMTFLDHREAIKGQLDIEFIALKYNLKIESEDDFFKNLIPRILKVNNVDKQIELSLLIKKILEKSFELDYLEKDIEDFFMNQGETSKFSSFKISLLHMIVNETRFWSFKNEFIYSTLQFISKDLKIVDSLNSKNLEKLAVSMGNISDDIQQEIGIEALRSICDRVVTRLKAYSNSMSAESLVKICFYSCFRNYGTLTFEDWIFIKKGKSLKIIGLIRKNDEKLTFKIFSLFKRFFSISNDYHFRDWIEITTLINHHTSHFSVKAKKQLSERLYDLIQICKSRKNLSNFYCDIVVELEKSYSKLVN